MARKKARPKPPPTHLVGRARQKIGAPWALAIHNVMRNWAHPLDYAIERMHEVSDDDTGGQPEDERRRQ